MTDSTNPFAAPQVVVGPEAPPLDESLDWPALRRVSRGLALYYYGIVLTLASILTAMAAGLLVGREVLIDEIAPFAVVVNLAVYALLSAGLFQCARAAPRESGVRQLGMAAAVLQLLVLLDFPMQLVLGDSWIPWAGAVCQLASWTSALLMLRGISLYVGNAQHAKRAVVLLVAGLALIVLFFAGVWSMNVAGDVELSPLTISTSLAMLLLGLMLAGIVVFVMYANLVNALRKLLRGASTAP